MIGLKKKRCPKCKMIYFRGKEHICQLQKTTLNIENFDDGLTRVAPEGEFKAHSPQDKALRLNASVTLTAKGVSEGDKTADISLPALIEKTKKEEEEAI